MNTPTTAQPLQLLPAAQKAADAKPADVLARWLGDLASGTRAKYRTAFARFVTWATGQHAKNAAETALRIIAQHNRASARELVLGWRASMTDDGLASATVASMVAAITSACAAFHDAGVLEFTIERVAPKVEPRQDRSGPKRHEVEQLVELIEADTSPAGLRDAALVRLLHDCALRRGEVVGLRACDVQLDRDGGPTVLALRKGFRERQPVLIGYKAAQALRCWLDCREAPDGAVPVFVAVGRGQRGQDRPLTGEAVRQILARRAKQAGIKSAVRPHGLRHSAASQVARRGSLKELQALGGWRSLSAASRYLDRLDTDRRKALSLVEA